MSDSEIKSVDVFAVLMSSHMPVLVEGLEPAYTVYAIIFLKRFLFAI